MDILTKHSKVIYQKGDKKTEGIIDLRGFCADKKTKRIEIKNQQISVNDIRIKKENLFIKTKESKKIAKNKEKALHNLFEKIVIESQEKIKEKRKNRKKYLIRTNLKFTLAMSIVPIIIMSFIFTQNQIEEKGKVMGVSTQAYDDFKAAADYISNSDFDMTTKSFDSANTNFISAQETINGLGLGIGKIISDLPVDTPLSTAQNLTEAGKNLSIAGENISEILKKISKADNTSKIISSFMNLDSEIKEISENINKANSNLQNVEIKYLPDNVQNKIALAQEALPIISANLNNFYEDYPLIKEILGNEKSQKYLLIFQNNSEIRATGGFIGSYGILDINKGEIENIFIDNIFNPDGQLQEKIVPPMPIQKISSAWSMHDSNWFADFPTSAKKIALFYEKTGGATVDGVISFTPEFLTDMLEITGPIEMPEYNITITKENFVTITQNQVESLYDKEENQPKKIISDLFPIILEKLFKEEDQEKQIKNLLNVLEKTEESLKEKHILIYHREEDIENILKKRGWGGELIQTEKDYLSVINSNINGYKTDAVIEESISLETEIMLDGSIINTLQINRKHTGGDSDYDWYNRVNADYMRVYVPEGSILLEASGNTIEEYIPPINYENFSIDEDIESIEKTLRIDKDSQTQIFEESGKTVFGNWVYVSPQEEVTITYKYKLPFKTDFKNSTSSVDSYSMIVQKQSGSIGSNFKSEIIFPENWKIEWRTNNLEDEKMINSVLKSDIKYGLVFTFY